MLYVEIGHRLAVLRQLCLQESHGTESFPISTFRGAAETEIELVRFIPTFVSNHADIKYQMGTDLATRQEPGDF
jgi:hypothetical protein